MVCGVVWYGMLWYDVAWEWHGVDSSGMAWCGIAWHGMAWQVKLHCTVPYWLEYHWEVEHKLFCQTVIFGGYSSLIEDKKKIDSSTLLHQNILVTSPTTHWCLNYGDTMDQMMKHWCWLMIERLLCPPPTPHMKYMEA